MITRRRLLFTLPAFTANLQAQLLHLPHRRPPVTPSHTSLLYIGVDTAKGVGKGIYVASFDSSNGHLSEPQLAAETYRPAYFAFSPAGGARRVLYVGNEGSDLAASTITSFLVTGAPKAPTLRQIGKVTAGFAGPAYVSIDSTGHAVFVANYGGGGVTSFRVLPDGTLSEPVERINYKDPGRFGKRGPNADRQDAPHPHCATLSPDNRFLLVNDLGDDEISVFIVDPETARLTAGEPHLFSNNRPGSGPRHVAFHPNGRWLYSINELDSTIDHFLFTTTHHAVPQAMLVDAGPPVSTLDPGFSGKNTAAEIVIPPDGYYLYASNRGEDSLVAYTIDPDTGSLKFLQRLSCGGKTPRQFTLDSTGQWLVCGNQDSASVAVFRRDPANGRLSGPTQTIAIDSPMCTLFA